MALTTEQTNLIISQLEAGIRLPLILREIDVSRVDFRVWKQENREDFRNARLAGMQAKKQEPSAEQRLTKLQQRRTRLASRLARLDTEIVVVEAE